MRKLSYDESHIKSVMNDVFNININPSIRSIYTRRL